MVLVFGATGFSGRMVVQRLVEREIPVRIAARSQDKLEQLSERFGGLDWVVADVADPPSLTCAAEGTSALVTTVGPYTLLGHVAAEAALAAGIPYFDITGEPGWLRKVFNEYGPRFAEQDLAMLPAFGYDYVPGNLAGAISLERAGDDAASVDIGYFLTGRNERTTQSFSQGTLDSLEASSKELQYAFRGGELIDVDGPKRVLDFEVDDEVVTAVAIGGTEHFALPRLSPSLREVNVGLGWFAAKATSPDADETRADGPSDSARAQARTNVIAIARASSGEELSRVQVDGPNPYDLSGLLTAWAVERLLDGELLGAGALGPVDAFGLDPLRAGCAEAGLAAVS
jgi:short subunit dehydrogenase-like uncharacterized protein